MTLGGGGWAKQKHIKMLLEGVESSAREFTWEREKK